MNLLYLKELSDQELELLKKVPALITILIGGADDDLDTKEIHMGKTSTFFRKENGDELVHDYFKWVSTEYENIFDKEWDQFKAFSSEERTAKITDLLSQTNEILHKIDKKYAHTLATSWRGLARAVANTSGGILGKMSVAPEEKNLIGLDMIHIR